MFHVSDEFIERLKHTDVMCVSPSSFAIKNILVENNSSETVYNTIREYGDILTDPKIIEIHQEKVKQYAEQLIYAKYHIEGIESSLERAFRYYDDHNESTNSLDVFKLILQAVLDILNKNTTHTKIKSDVGFINDHFIHVTLSTTLHDDTLIEYEYYTSEKRFLFLLQGDENKKNKILQERFDELKRRSDDNFIVNVTPACETTIFIKGDKYA